MMHVGYPNSSHVSQVSGWSAEQVPENPTSEGTNWCCFIATDLEENIFPSGLR